MDISDEYIKMILALPDEFFDGWVWNYGDTFVLKVASDKWIVHHIGDFELINNDIGTWVPIGGCESTFEKVEEERRPIPSQEQLQDKIIKSQNCKPSDVFNLFQTWYYIYSHQKDNRMFNSFREAWLHCHMWLEKKEWDGESWVKI